MWLPPRTSKRRGTSVGSSANWSDCGDRMTSWGITRTGVPKTAGSSRLAGFGSAPSTAPGTAQFVEAAGTTARTVGCTNRSSGRSRTGGISTICARSKRASTLRTWNRSQSARTNAVTTRAFLAGRTAVRATTSKGALRVPSATQLPSAPTRPVSALSARQPWLRARHHPSRCGSTGVAPRSERNSRRATYVSRACRVPNAAAPTRPGAASRAIRVSATPDNQLTVIFDRAEAHAARTRIDAIHAHMLAAAAQ